MQYLKTFLKYFTNSTLIPRFRGYVNGVIHSFSSTKSLIYSPICFTGKYIKIGSSVVIYKNCRIQGITSYVGRAYTPSIVLMQGVSIQQNCHITCAESISIGDNTAIASNVTITDIDHPYHDIAIPIEKQPLDVAPVVIGRDCKIYNNAVILRGTIIGNHCVVGANSVVKGTFPDNCIIVGCPARIVKRYNENSNRWEPTTPEGIFKLDYNDTNTTKNK